MASSIAAISIAVGGVKTVPVHGASSMAPISVALQVAAVEDATGGAHRFDRFGGGRRFDVVGGEAEGEFASRDFREHRDCVFVTRAGVFEIVQWAQRLQAVHRDVGGEAV